MHQVSQVAKALGDPNRLRIIFALAGRELCVCQITELLGLAPSTISKHMYILRQAQLVTCRKQGRWIHYRLIGRGGPKPAADAIKWIRTSLANDPQILRDAKRLQKILRMDPEKLCSRQARRKKN